MADETRAVAVAFRTVLSRALRGFAAAAVVTSVAAAVAVRRADTALDSPLLLCALTVAVAGVGSVLPFSPIEPFLLGVAAVAPPRLLLPVALLATASHMAGKALLYLGSRDARLALPARQQARVERARARMSRARPLQYLTVLVSAATGVPPFYAVTVVCGVLRVPLAGFLAAGTAGRGMRFAALVTAPLLLGAPPLAAQEAPAPPLASVAALGPSGVRRPVASRVDVLAADAGARAPRRTYTTEDRVGARAVVGTLGWAAGAFVGGMAGLFLFVDDCRSCNHSRIDYVLLGAGVGGVVASSLVVAGMPMGDGCRWPARFGSALGGAAVGTVVGVVIADAFRSERAALFTIPISGGLGAAGMAEMCRWASPAAPAGR